ncbi:hypothetical protein F7725_013384 [Dissostichus mawsoni]|uniref:Uncharacterized protein n=1 Tax=Dissostichus mawsoni TaxID=36200 RepID=A0A7J5YPW9_DISMA|nr:hypothetical protein F7725_013384 [Dissostichus mawsoni]
MLKTRGEDTLQHHLTPTHMQICSQLNCMFDATDPVRVQPLILCGSKCNNWKHNTLFHFFISSSAASF